MCVSVSHAIACHGKEKNKKRSDTLWGLVCHACRRLLIPAIGEHLIAEFFMRFVITMIAVGLISKKISWEMIYCTVWPLIVYHCINIIWNSVMDNSRYTAAKNRSEKRYCSTRGCCSMAETRCRLFQIILIQ